MSRKDIYVAVGIFLIIFFTRVYFAALNIENKFTGGLDYFLATSFGALLALFQQAARLQTNVQHADVQVKE